MISFFYDLYAKFNTVIIYMTNSIRIFFFSFMLLFTLGAHAQMIDSMMNVYAYKFPQEKITF